MPERLNQLPRVGARMGECAQRVVGQLLQIGEPGRDLSSPLTPSKECVGWEDEQNTDDHRDDRLDPCSPRIGDADCDEYERHPGRGAQGGSPASLGRGERPERGAGEHGRADNSEERCEH